MKSGYSQVVWINLVNITILMPLQGMIVMAGVLNKDHVIIHKQSIYWNKTNVQLKI